MRCVIVIWIHGVVKVLGTHGRAPERANSDLVCAARWAKLPPPSYSTVDVSDVLGTTFCMLNGYISAGQPAVMPAVTELSHQVRERRCLPDWRQTKDRESIGNRHKGRVWHHIAILALATRALSHSSMAW